MTLQVSYILCQRLVAAVSAGKPYNYLELYCPRVTAALTGHLITMSYEEHAEGVRDDYREALEGLTGNARVEINNLTMIARENTEFAFVIADVLQEHIKKVGLCLPKHPQSKETIRRSELSSQQL